jgi:hypothetical protein
LPPSLPFSSFLQWCRDGTQSLVHARRVLHHWATFIPSP